MWLIWLVSIVASIPVLLFAYYRYLRRNDGYWPSRGVPLLHISEVAPLFDRITFKKPFITYEHGLYKVLRQHGVKSYAGIMEQGKPALVLIDLDLIKSVLVKDFDHFVDRRPFDVSKADPYLNEMLTSLHGQKWKNVRTTLSPTFTTGRIRRMFQVFNECGDKMTQFLKEETAKPGIEETDCRDLCSRYTMDVIANAAFGVDSRMFQDADAEFARLGKRMQNQLNTPFGKIKLLLFIIAPKLLNLLRISIFDKQATEFFAGVVKSSIAHRESTGTKREDFLQLLIETQKGELNAEDDDKAKGTAAGGAGGLVVQDDGLSQELQKGTKVNLTEISLIAQTILFFFAGFDTIETLLLYVMYELAVNPEIQEKLHQEIKEAVDNSKDGTLEYDTLMNLQYLDMVISETLRKYPAGIRLERRCTKEYTLPGTEVTLSKDQVAIIPVWGIHHDPEYYPEPEKFIPERFSPENKANRHPYSYMPFGQGPRSCIAMRFALVEGKAATAHLIHKFILEPSKRTPIPLQFEKITVKPEGGLWLKISERT